MHRLHLDTKRKQKRMGGDTYMEKVSTMALCSLTTLIVSQTKKVFQKQSNGRCSLGMYSIAHIVFVCYRLHCGIYTYTCGLLRCSTLKDGQCETPRVVGRATGTATHTFCLYVPNINQITTSLVWVLRDLKTIIMSNNNDNELASSTLLRDTPTNRSPPYLLK